MSNPKEDIIVNKLSDKLTDIGFTCKKEKIFRGGSDYKTKSGKVRKSFVKADLAVYKNKNLVVLIEVKDRPGKSEPKKGRQYQRYLLLGLPFLYCMNESQIETTIERIESIWNLR